MGKKLRQQRAGRGTPTFVTPEAHRIGAVRYPKVYEKVAGVVLNIIHAPGMSAPVAQIRLEDGTTFFNQAVMGIYVGQRIEYGRGSNVTAGNIVRVGDVQEGVNLCNLEIVKGDGGKLARSAGSYVTVVGRSGDKVIVRLPSGKVMEVSEDARATVGTVAGGGAKEKPLLKAGASYYKYKNKAKKWPTVRGVAMNVVSHPHGGGLHPSVSRSSTVSRNAPPGRKVGHIAAKRTGRKGGETNA
jgi:large subunit ribosomal protein L2